MASGPEFQFSRKAFKPYQAIRHRKNRKTGCLAPSENLFFGLRGNVYSCCFNKTHPIGKYPEQSILQVWKGSQRTAIEKGLKAKDFSYGCQPCYHIISSGNYAGLPAQNYESLTNSKGNFPSKMEFELDNQCNLECVMCRGEFSSAIRRNREKLPPIPSPYGADFVEELKPFIPHLKEAHFLGGEPFMIPIFFDIWEMMATLNPKIKVSVQTNATILTDRIRKLLNKMDFQIGVSIDSIDPENYAIVRKNGDFEKVWQNIQELRTYSRGRETGFHLSYCPMTYNWRELPDVIRTCNELDCTVFFNTVYYPKHCSFTSLGKDELNQILNYLQTSKNDLPSRSNSEQMNLLAFQGVIDQIAYWISEGQYTDKVYTDFEEYLEALKTYLYSIDQENAESRFSDFARKLNLILDKADESGLKEKAKEKLMEVSFKDIADHFGELEDNQLLTVFQSFIMPLY